jgi:hypothetical protein
MNEVPAAGEMDLKLSQDLKSPIIRTAIRVLARTSAAVVSVARIDPGIGSYTVIQFKKFPPICEVAHTPLVLASYTRCGSRPLRLGAFRWRVLCREQVCGATARRESSSTIAHARRASGLSRSSDYLTRILRMT